jgi:formylmethanofuran dehydrogenase subunit B
MSALTIVPSTIFADVIIPSAISAEVKGTAEGLFPIKGIINFL